METIFTKIVNREIPATVIYEDDLSIAFLDINPVTKGHLLLVSKKPYMWMQDVPDEILGKIFITAKELMIAMKESLGADYVQVSVVGKDVPHFHIHLIPRKLDDTFLRSWSTITYANDAERDSFAEQIKKFLQ